MKRLVLFSDGTGNSSAKAEKTNVWRLFEALDQTTFDQLAKYDDGVGTSANKYLAALGGAFGYGLKRNVIDLYKFVCRNYDGDAGDKFYGFGFSRGAFTIRVVAALIATQGLVRARSESELNAMALTAYRQYRIERFKSYSPLVIAGRWLRDHVLMPASGIALRKHRQTRIPGSVPIEFLGLWDTVGAYGMPIDELKWGFDKLVWPMVAVDRHLSPVIRHCSHALALDEQRQTFTPTLFDESFEAAEVKAGRVASGRLTQVWFCGVHSNVGGGYPEDKLSLVTLDWIASQAVAAGLRFDQALLAENSVERSGYARIYDSRAGIAAYYRYDPRSTNMGCYPSGEPIRPIIHGSVIMRMAKGSDAYAPIALPAEFDVLAPDGQLLPMHGFPYGDKSLYLRDARPKSSLAPDHLVDERVKTLAAAIAEFQASPPEPEMVEQVRDTVWWRRVTYFATLAMTLMLVAFPFAAGAYAALVEAIVNKLGAGYGTKWNAGVSQLDQYAHSIVGPATKAAGRVLPAYVDLWLNALALRPLEMITAIVMVAIPYAAGSFLGSRIHDRAWFAWHPQRRADYVAWIGESFRRSLIKAAVAAFKLGLLTWFAHVHWNGEPLGAIIHLAFYASLVVLVWRLLLSVRRHRLDKNGISSSVRVPITPTLWVARKLRSARWLTAIYDFMAERAVPVVVALVVLAAMVGVTLHAVYVAQDAAGWFCTGTAAQVAQVSADAKTATQTGFDASDVCWASGIAVKAGRHYRAELDIADGDAWWFDRLKRTDPAGFAGTDIKHLSAAVLKRSWSARWFAPMLRVGRLGLDEFAMTAVCKGHAECESQTYEEPKVDGLPIFSPIPADVAQRLVDDRPHPDAPRSSALDFVAEHDGELYLYVNDALLPWPPGGGAFPFYRNNTGGGRLKVVDTTDCDASATCGDAQRVSPR